MKRTLKLSAWACLLMGLLLLCAPAIAQSPDRSDSATPWRSPQGISLNADTVLEDLTQASIVYLGETHDNPADHEAQLTLIQALSTRRPQMAIALEMFQRPYQAALDQYLAGTISETELQQRSQYQQRWGFPWDYYAPILRFAQTQQLPLLALNTPTEVTRKVAKSGLESLSAADRQWIPAIADIDLSNAAYRQSIQQVYEAIHQGHSVSSSSDFFFQAQVVWDETMAEGIANFLTCHPNTQIIVLVGQGHITYGDGIPSRVARRLSGIEQRSILLNPDPEDLSQNNRGAIADYLWMSPSP
ncbi:MAG: ChaN family lipoprotein [Oscillatoriophycideae cyanobacterium NC_groundwater_1537_Pr4_S-0.65um_50_18]|nr:ChaN family lipoprotein [Oscillatoriophycideae cyanobacterium NC_groundwater_1537_Pr4_S-0.65um_50_18]